jgi:shikimate kinase
MGARADRIILIGLRRAGKSTVGRALAASLDRPFLDTDELVSVQTRRSVGDWIRRGGLDAFREVESRVLRSALADETAVLSVGGGTPISPENRAAMRPGSTILYLRADPAVLADRAGPDPHAEGRPPLTHAAPREEAFIVFAERDGLYREFCDAIVDADATPAEVDGRCRRRLEELSALARR